MHFYDQLLDILASRGVTTIFGVPGDAINPLIEAIRKQDQVRFVHVAHEEAGAFAASAQAKLTGNLAVCCGTVGPGAIHLLNGLYDASKDYAPVLAIAGQVPSDELGLTFHQEVDLDALFSDVAVYHTSVRTAEQMPRVALEACNTAVAESGVAVLTVPADIGRQKVPDADYAKEWSPRHRVLPDPEHVADAAELINGADDITILYGEGCRDAVPELKAIAEHLKAPIIHSLKAKDLLPSDYPNIAGGLGLLGDRGGVVAAQGCDVMLVVGSDFPYRDWYPDAPIIRIDRNASTIGRRTPRDIGIVGDSAESLRTLLEQLDEKTDDALLRTVQRSRSRWDSLLELASNPERSKDLIHPQGLARVLGELADGDAVFTCDTGAVSVWAARHLRMTGSQRLSLSYNLASMAYAMPAAIGAQLAFPDRQVLSLSGDGGFNMLMGDLLTAVRYRLPIKIIIFNNGKLGLIQMEQEVEGFPEHLTGLHNPDYALLAEAFGATGQTVKNPADLRMAVAEALAHDGPYVLDVHVNPGELTMPPKIELEQAWGFSRAKVKEVLGELVS
ncbi:MAG: hypothetical protein JJ896_16085 [Rhodothermales bacterium]|nr:hypothetical protein [Rhodothermales bacterium]MBO6781175.1 hypothetical protein [Rhodothermales bacterium]